MLEQRRPITHIKELLLRIPNPGLTLQRRLPVIRNLIAPLQQRRNNNTDTRQRNTNPKARVVLRTLRLKIHETPQDPTDITNTVHQRNPNCSPRRRGNVVRVPGRGGRLNRVDTDDGQDDGEICYAHVGLELAL